VTEGDVALASASAFVGALARHGLRDACLSPGSRSTPIALALSRDDRIRVHVHLDERASAYFALGLAKASGRPVAVACTSGTAAANLLPAVVEAWMSRTPLIALTADRPPELRNVGANQTIDQIDLFGRYVRWFVEAPVPREGLDALRSWAVLAAEAYGRACAPGPVHVNLPFREPLVPSGGPVPLEKGADAAAEIEVGEGRRADDEEVEAFARSVEGVERGLLYVGTLRTPSPSVVRLAARLGWPAIAEPTSGSRVPGTLASGPFLLANPDFLEPRVPDLLVQVGAAPTSRAGLALAAAARRLVIVDPDELVADPHRRAERRFAVHAGDLADRAARVIEPGDQAPWLEAWRRADAAAGEAVDRAIDVWVEPFEGRVARDLAASLPYGSALVVGSSMPVRDLDAYMRPRTGLRVLANRGASGIDGFVSTALGVAASGIPTTALCGDLTLLHDAGSFLWSARRGLQVTFVVPNNDGGVIFSFLEQRNLPEMRELFTTPHGLDLAALSSAAGATHHRVERSDELVPVVDAARDGDGVHVVEVVVDPDLNVRRHAEVHTAVAEALAR
jgi:2-succinyl-5-enolpyruvyl-6-hydroxy-3-cyclohexene-1-carboxylate synthase